MVKAFAVDVPGATVEERMASLGRGLAETVRVRWIDKPRTRRRERRVSSGSGAFFVTIACDS